MVKILDKYTYKEFLKIPFENEIVNLIVKIMKEYWQGTTDAFTFLEEILKRDASLFWVLAVSKEMK